MLWFNTVNSEFFTRSLFLRNFAYAKFCENKTLRNGKITLSFIDIGKSCLNLELFTSLICLNAIRENKILAKISKSTERAFW